VDLSKLNVYQMTRGGAQYVSCVTNDMKHAVHKSVSALKKIPGIQFHNFERLGFARSLDFFFANLFKNGAGPMSKAFKKYGEELYPAWEVFLKLFGQSHHSFDVIHMTWLDNQYRKSSLQQLTQDLEEFKAFAKDIQETLGTNGVLICPAQICPAPFHHGSHVNTNAYLSITPMFNLLGMPCTVCPMGLNDEGIPLAVSIVANRNRDGLTIAVARELANVHGGWRPPCQLQC